MLHRYGRRILLRSQIASDLAKSNISSATTNSKSGASLLPFIVIWKVKKKTNKGIEKFHLLVGLSIRPWKNWMFSFKVMSQIERRITKV